MECDEPELPFSFLYKDANVDAIVSLEESQLDDLIQRVHKTIVTEQPKKTSLWLAWFCQMTLQFVPGANFSRRENVRETGEEHKKCIMRLYRAMQIKGTANFLKESTLPTLNMLKEIFELLYNAYEAIYTLFSTVENAKAAKSRGHSRPRTLSQLPIVWLSDLCAVPYQKLILHVLGELAKLGFRRLGNDCYKQVSVDGINTHYWQKECSIMEFIYRSTTKETTFAQWCHLTASRDFVPAVNSYLSNGCDVEFPTLVTNRYLFSFTNGIYDIENNTFISYSEMTNEHDSLVSVRLFKTEFNADYVTCPVENIPSPEFASIFEFQDYDAASILWAFIMCGRVLYPVGRFDNWQVGVFFKGVAGSGKSTIANIMKYLYPPTMVGTLSSNGEEKFALSALYDKLIYVCSEVKTDFALDQGDWQSMVSGEEVSVAIKHEIAKSMKWSVPGILCGNELPGWIDAAGSVLRRLLVFNFERKVHDGDPELFDRMKQNVGGFICKINRCYRTACEEHGKEDIWKEGILPDLLLKVHKDIQEDVDPLAAFLASPQVIMDGALYVEQNAFRDAYFQYREENGLRSVKWSKDVYLNTFQEASITPSRKVRPWPIGNSEGKTAKKFFMGVALQSPAFNTGLHAAFHTANNAKGGKASDKAAESDDDNIFEDIGTMPP